MPRPPSRAKRLTEQDRADWAQYARLIAPLPGHDLDMSAAPQGPPAPPATASQSAAPPIAPARAAAEPPRPISVGLHPGGLDNGTWNRFRSGKLAAARTLDLHGRTAQHAYHALHGFLVRAHADHVRCVEVITGRGSGEAGGVIRREFPIWLNLPTLRPLVLAASHPHAGNPGSVRLLLRRPK